MNIEKDNLPLASYRALDLSTDRGYVCGKILAELGMDVIKVEPPGGDSGRNIGPFFKDIPDKNRSLYFFAFNNNKRSITLNIENNDGKEIFKKLLKTADFVIESFAPGYLEKLGLGYTTLKEINPHIILVSITPFGQTGPRKEWKASDIVEIALGGLSHITGDPDMPPLRVSIDQAHIVTGYQAAMGALIANYYRQTTGKGQQVDISIQESVVISALTVPQAWDLQKFIWPREGACLSRSGKRVRYIWPCKDGYIAWRMFGGGLGVKTRALVEWMEREGQAGELSKVIWTKMDYMRVNKEDFYRWQNVFLEFFKKHTKEELSREALARGIVLLPVSTPRDLLEDRQLLTRNYWQEVQYPDLSTTITYPGEIFKSSAYHIEIRRAPLIGENNDEVYDQELGFSNESLAILKYSGVI